jgi:TatD DNase family protein
MKFDYFDIHSHFNLEHFDADRDEAIKTLEEKKVGTICVGIDKKSSELSIEISKQSKNIFSCIGLHPQEVVNEKVFDYEFYEKLTHEDKVVCIGECGLDYFRIDKENLENKNAQRKAFREQIALALETNLPLMLHIRPAPNSYDAYEEVLEILEKAKGGAGEFLRGDAHFFAGTLEHAKRFNDLGFSVSFTGVITFTDDYNETVINTPINMLFAETDSPFVAPVPHRGKRAEPWMVGEVYAKIAELRGISIEDVQKAFKKNIKKMFNI